MTGSLPATLAKSNGTERVMNMKLMSGSKCFRAKVALSLLGNARESLKFVPVRFIEKDTLAFLD
jgi:hypothetical protein